MVQADDIVVNLDIRKLLSAIVSAFVDHSISLTNFIVSDLTCLLNWHSYYQEHFN